MRKEYNLDVLKPHEPNNDLLAHTIEKLPGVTFVQIKTEEIDQKTMSIILIIKGNEELSLDDIRTALEEMNCALHSVDLVQIDKRSS